MTTLLSRKKDQGDLFLALDEREELKEDWVDFGVLVSLLIEFPEKQFVNNFAGIRSDILAEDLSLPDEQRPRDADAGDSSRRPSIIQKNLRGAGYDGD